MDYWPQIISAMAGLVGSLIGAGAALYGQHLTRSYEQSNKRRAIAFALAAEIEAYLDLVGRRGIIELAESLAQQSKKGFAVEIKDWISDQERGADPFPIFSANLSNIGLLGPSCSEVGSFYMRVNAIRLTIIGMQDGKYSACNPKEIASIISGELDMWAETRVMAMRLIRNLRAV